MSTTTVERAINVFNEAIELEGADREAFLARACRDEPRLLAEVRSLLETEPHVPARGFLEPSPAREDHDGADAASLVGARVGSYTILDVLGTGGMGTVLRAEQQSPHRMVALKLIRPGLMGGRARRRFEHEAELLGRLQHPGIAQIFEAGTADTPYGPCPFFAMELVDGLPLTEHAAARGLDTRERLRLMAEICDAVHHAHQNGVIHRDLKPGNILVTGSGQPKILDFGVARAIDSDVAVTTLRTHVGELIGTLQYMSPEQCEGDPAKIDTRSDIYTLGVICWQLLAGELPYDVKGRPFPEIIRIIREQELDPLRSVSGTLRGDVETIVAKAMEKDRERRYQSASSLARDLRRYLRHEPISARPLSAMYQFRRFARRNRAFVWGVAAVFLVLMAGIAATTWQAVRATRGWRAAEYRQNESERNAQMHTALITAVLRADPTDEEAFEHVVDALSKVRRGTFGPAAHEVVADVYRRIGNYDLAEAHLRRAWSHHRREGETHARALHSINLLADVLRQSGRLQEASSLLRETLNTCGYVAGAESRYLGEARQCTFALRLLSLRLALAKTRRDQGRLEEAEAMLGEVQDATMLVLGELDRLQPEIQGHVDLARNPSVLEIRESRAELLLERGENERAEAVFRELRAIRRDMNSLDALSSATLERGLGEALLAQSQLDEAETLLTRAEARLIPELGPESPGALLATNALGRLRLAQGRLDDADRRLSFVADTAEHRYPGHWRTAVFRGDVGVLLLHQQRDGDARNALTVALRHLTELFGNDDLRVQRVRRAIDEVARAGSRGGDS